MNEKIRKIFDEKIIFDEKTNTIVNWNFELRNNINNEIFKILNNKNININIKEDNNLKEILNDFKKKRGFEKGNIIGSKIELNPSYKELVCHNINKLSFKYFYPKIIEFLIKKNLITLENKYFYPFTYVLNNVEKIHQNDNKLKISINLFLNYLYGYIITNNEKFKINCENKENIIFFVNYVMDELYNKLGLNVIYCDTDEIYYGGDKKIPTYLIKEIFVDYDIPYDIEKIDNCIFFERKKYIIANKGDLKIYGFKSVQV